MSEYDTDVLSWSEHQAALLRRLAAGETVDWVDWENVIEEIESVGRQQLHAVESLLMQAMIHMLKTYAWPLSRDRPSWQAEAMLFRRQVRHQFTNSMRQRLNIADLYADALAVVSEMDEMAQPLPATCPWTLNDLLII